MLLIISLFLVAALCFKHSLADSSAIPKDIWSYWDGDEAADIITTKCHENWRRFNKDSYNIHVLKREDIMTQLKEDGDTTQLQTFINIDQVHLRVDFVRLYLLYKYGGVWLDGSVLMTTSLDHYFKQKLEELSYHGVMYFLGRDYKFDEVTYPFETFFIAVPPKHRFIELWFQRFKHILQVFKGDGREYIDYLENDVSDLNALQERRTMLSGMKRDTGYGLYKMTVSVVAMDVYRQYFSAELQLDEDNYFDIKLLVAEDGPFRYHRTKQRPRHQLIQEVQQQTQSIGHSTALKNEQDGEVFGEWTHSFDQLTSKQVFDPPMIVKLTRADRAILLEYLSKEKQHGFNSRRDDDQIANRVENSRSRSSSQNINSRSRSHSQTSSQSSNGSSGDDASHSSTASGISKTFDWVQTAQDQLDYDSEDYEGGSLKKKERRTKLVHPDKLKQPVKYWTPNPNSIIGMYLFPQKDYTPDVFAWKH